MKVGIVGLAGSGKTTIFNALTGLKAEVGGYGGKDKSNIGMIKVPDERIEELVRIYKPKKKVYAEMAFADFAGPEGEKAKSGSDLDPKAVADMREVDALVHVVRGFNNPIVERSPDPMRDIKAFETELILADLIPIENRLNRLKKEKANPREKELIEKCKAALESEQPLRSMDLTAEDWQLLAGFRFLTQKPMMILLNQGEGEIGKPAPEVENYARENGLKMITMCGKAEMEIAELPREEQDEFLKDLGISEPARDRFIRAAYELLDLISFLTSGEDECRAWTIRRGTIAQRAAGKVHSDIERGFIRAEVVAFKDFMDCGGSEARCKEVGKMRLEGKEYVVHDGDIINFRFNV